MRIFFKFLKEKGQQGVSLYMTIILMAILLAMVLGVTSIIMNGLDIAKGVTDSVKAFHAADTGIENALYQIRIESNCACSCSSPDKCDFSWGDSEWYCSFTNYDCILDPPSVLIKSRGVYHDSQRTIEVQYQ